MYMGLAGSLPGSLVRGPAAWMRHDAVEGRGGHCLHLPTVLFVNRRRHHRWLVLSWYLAKSKAGSKVEGPALKRRRNNIAVTYKKPESWVISWNKLSADQTILTCRPECDRMLWTLVHNWRANVPGTREDKKCPMVWLWIFIYTSKCFKSPKYQNGPSWVFEKKTSQELRMLSRPLSDCISLLLNECHGSSFAICQ